MAIIATGLDLALRGRPVLRDVTARFAPGRITAIIGPNGAGKSSLLHCIAGLRAPDRGMITVGGMALAALDPADRARRIGLLPQRAEIHWDIDVRTLVALGRLPHNHGWRQTPADAQAIDHALAATDMAAFADRKALRLSGGEQARALLARVLAGTPDWLLADEPFASLDPAHAIDIAARLRQAADASTGVILVLHDLTLAARIADDVLLMEQGRVLATGTARDVLTAPLLEQAFGIRAYIGQDDEGQPVIIAAGRSPTET